MHHKFVWSLSTATSHTANKAGQLGVDHIRLTLTIFLTVLVTVCVLLRIKEPSVHAASKT